MLGFKKCPGHLFPGAPTTPIAELVAQADALVVITGAGMDVDSGLGTFRGAKAYHYQNEKKLDYVDLCNPKMYTKDPMLADAFWSDMCEQFLSHRPHEGYTILQTLASRKRFGAFSFTTNITGYWAEFAPMDRLVEIHGSTKYLQCREPTKGACHNEVWLRPASTDTTHLCLFCQGPTRPAVLMFEDWSFNERRVRQQMAHYGEWLRQVKAARARVVVLEIGCGTTVMTGRGESNHLARKLGAAVVRVNAEDPTVDRLGFIPVKMGALAFLQQLQTALGLLARPQQREPEAQASSEGEPAEQ